MDRPVRVDDGEWMTARFATAADRNRFVIDVRAVGSDAIAVEVAGELEVHVRASGRLRAGAIALLFAHGGRVVEAEAAVEPRSRR